MKPLCILQTTSTDGISKKYIPLQKNYEEKLGHSGKGSYTSDQAPSDNIPNHGAR